MRLHWLAVKVLGLALLFSCLVLAQTGGTGSISGIVQDSSGAVIPGVSVTVTNTGTGVSSTSVTTATGSYHVPSLIPGNYEVKAEISGFQTEIRRGLDLTVGADVGVNLSLKVGQVTQQEVVTGEAALVDTSNSTLSGLVDDKTIRDLPLNGRSFDQLISLDSSAPTFSSRGRATVYGEANEYTVNGHGTQANLFLIDGNEMQGAGSSTQLPGGVLGINLGIDAIQEFSIMTSNYTAVYGKKAGAIVNIATRSGTNAFHGSGFEFLRNSYFDARNFYDGNIPAFRRNEFGGAIGGRIRKNKSFFFINYEGLTLSEGLSKVSVVPDVNAHNGFLPCASAPKIACVNGLANVGVNPAVAPYLNSALFPLPNGPSFGDGTAGYTSNPIQTENSALVLARFDQRISDNDFFFARYNYDQANISAPDTSEEANIFDGVSYDRDQDATLEYKRIFSPTTINLIRSGFGRAFINSSEAVVGAGIPKSLWLLPGAVQMGQITFSTNGNAVANQGITRVGPANAAPRDYAVTQYDESDQLFHYVGKHSLQFGVGIQRNDANDNAGVGATNGTYTFGSLQTFLQGTPSMFSGALPAGDDPHKSWRRDFFYTYFQDDYKVTKNLTVNLGLRYELLTPPVDATGRLSNFHSTYNSNGILVFNPTPTIGGNLYPGNHLNFAPRFGFAWDPFSNGKTSVRGGFGTFYNQDLETNHFYLSGNPPFATSFTVTNPPFPNALAGNLTAPLPSGQSIDQGWKTATSLQWNISLQHQITSNQVVSVAYLGVHSYHLPRTWSTNTFVPEFLVGGQVYSSNVPGSTVFYPTGQPRLQPALSSGGIVTTDVNASYNALQADFTQKLKYGLRARVSFTYSHALDTGPGAIASYVTGELGVTENRYNPLGDYGNSAFNLKYNMASNFTYNIPWRQTTGFSGKLFGGWQLGGIITVHPGTPFTVTTGFSQSRSGDNSTPDRPNLAAGVTSVPINGNPVHYFDSSVFVLPPVGTFGNLGRNTLVGPGFADFDSSLVKSTAINERLRMDFRAEFFNILNHANFALPSSVIFQSNGSYLGSAGKIASTLTTSRQIQLGVKFTF